MSDFDQLFERFDKIAETETDACPIEDPIDVDAILHEFLNQDSKICRGLKGMPINARAERILNTIKNYIKEHGYISEEVIVNTLFGQSDIQWIEVNGENTNESKKLNEEKQALYTVRAEATYRVWATSEKEAEARAKMVFFQEVDSKLIKETAYMIVDSKKENYE